MEEQKSPLQKCEEGITKNKDANVSSDHFVVPSITTRVLGITSGREMLNAPSKESNS